MSESPYSPPLEAPDVVSRDLDHLRILSIFYYVYAGFTFFFALIPLIYIGLGIAMLSGALDLDNAGGNPPPPEIGYIFIAVGGGLMCLGMLMGALMIMAGRRLAAQRGYTYCMVIAVLLCLHFPLGTVLGVFTIVILMRDSVKALFDERARGAYY